MRRISDLRPGDSIFGWMKLGFALRKQRQVDGSLYRDVPTRHDRFDKDDLQNFIGMVISNDPVNHILVVDTSRMTKMGRSVEPPLRSEIPYMMFKRIRYISKYAHTPRPQNPVHPTNIATGTGFFAYRTQEEVDCTWN